jgi:hypothetical protein
MRSNSDSFHLIEGDLVTGAIVKLGGPGAFMGSHRLGVFERAAGLEISGDPGRAEHVAAKLAFQSGFGRAAADHLVCVDAVHRPVGKDPGSAGRRAEEGGLAAVPDARRIEIFIKELLELVMGRHLVALAAFLIEPQPPALPVGEVVLDLHRDDRADAGKAVDHHADQRAVAQADEPWHLGFRAVG